MSGPTERLRIELVTDDKIFDLGVLECEVEPQRAWRGLVSAEGEFPLGETTRKYIDLLIQAQLDGMQGRETTFRITPAAAAEGVFLAYTVEAFAWRGFRFSLLLTREPDVSPMFAHPKPGDDESEAANGDD